MKRFLVLSLITISIAILGLLNTCAPDITYDKNIVIGYDDIAIQNMDGYTINFSIDGIKVDDNEIPYIITSDTKEAVIEVVITYKVIILKANIHNGMDIYNDNVSIGQTQSDIKDPNVFETEPVEYIMTKRFETMIDYYCIEDNDKIIYTIITFDNKTYIDGMSEVSIY